MQETEKMGTSNSTSMRDTPWNPAANETVTLVGTRTAKTILASSQKRPHKQAGHMDASYQRKTISKTLQ
ncbi:MAG: hypothetical protein MI919_07135, partial [Holophagales bacterium]|nr:hypothetical protein [Holophagales bacterium]